MLCLIAGASAAFAQTSGFTYQGRLTDGGTAANGNYDLQFALFDSLSGGAQVGSTQTLNTVAVSNGVFTVSLDFGANAFPGASRFLEIGARLAGSGSFTPLTPRQPITSTPYAVRSLNAASADSVPASGVSAGSGNYIQNASAQQAASNFNISGNGTAGGTLSGGVVNATTQYNLNGTRILSNPGTDNLFAGAGAGAANTAGARNTFIGSSAGTMLAGQTDSDNTFIGARAGRSANGTAQNTFVGSAAGFSTTGCCNAFVGTFAGSSNTTGTNNAFFGNRAGSSNNTGSTNAFFGDQVGQNNSAGSNNAFFGFGTGNPNSSGSRNAFFGSGAGFSSGTGNEDTLIGYDANVASPSLTNATAIGANARVDASNALVLGSINGINGATADTNVGIRTTNPLRTLQIGAGTDALFTFDPSNGSPNAGFIRFGDNTGWKLHIGRNRESSGGGLNNGTGGVLMTVQDNGSVGIGTTGPLDRLHVFGDIRVGTNLTNGCLKRNDGNSIAGTCSSDVRFKRDITPFPSLLNQVVQLRPVHYYWRAAEFPEKHFGNTQAYGLVAQEVEQVLPELVSKDEQGYKQVDYSKLPLLLLQAVKEQQAQIQQQRELIERQQALANRQQQQLDALKKLACRSHRRAGVCK